MKNKYKIGQPVWIKPSNPDAARNGSIGIVHQLNPEYKDFVSVWVNPTQVQGFHITEIEPFIVK